MRAPKSIVGRARALRRKLMFPRIPLWQMLRGGRLDGARFRRQHPVGPHVLDFSCSDARLAVEVDGAAHDHPDVADRDAARDGWLAAQDIAVVRFPARESLDEDGRQSVLATIAARLAAPSTALRAVPLPRRTGRNSRGALHIPPDRPRGRAMRVSEPPRRGSPAYNAPVPG